MKDLSHLDAIQKRIANETARLMIASNERERAFRERQIKMAERELASEYKFLGIEPLTGAEMAMSDDELLAELLK